MTSHKTIESLIMDDRERMFPIKVSYEFFNKSWFAFATLVTNIEYNVCPDAQIGKIDLMDCIRDIIKEEENGLVEFE